MKLQMTGCSHHNASLDVRERLAFSPEQVQDALGQLRERFPDSETVLLSTCNRVELYVASEDPEARRWRGVRGDSWGWGGGPFAASRRRQWDPGLRACRKIVTSPAGEHRKPHRQFRCR